MVVQRHAAVGLHIEAPHFLAQVAAVGGRHVRDVIAEVLVVRILRELVPVDADEAMVAGVDVLGQRRIRHRRAHVDQLAGLAGGRARAIAWIHGRGQRRARRRAAVAGTLQRRIGCIEGVADVVAASGVHPCVGIVVVRVAALDVVEGAAHLDGEAVVAPVHVQARALGRVVALVEIHAQAGQALAGLVPAEGAGIVDVDIARHHRDLPRHLVAVVDDRRRRGRCHQHRRHIAVEGAVRVVDVAVDGQLVGRTELEAGIDAAEMGVFLHGPEFEAPEGVGEGAARDRAIG